jgi:dihydroorotate dehydrogenase electron transfer subunit
MGELKIPKKTYQATILENYALRLPGKLSNYLIRLRFDEKIICNPGQFFKFNVEPTREQEKPRLITVNEENETSQMSDSKAGVDFAVQQPLIARPFSIGHAEVQENTTILTFIYKIFGAGSLHISKLQQGETIKVLGPLGGNLFYLPKGKTRAIMVAGGVGFPPLTFLADSLLKKSIDSIDLFVGATSSLGLPLPKNLSQQLRSNTLSDLSPIFRVIADPKVNFGIATDDGSEGHPGLVTDLFERALIDSDPEKTMIYTCGPWPMMAKVARIAGEHGLDCQACLEEMMGCGIGACQSCVVRIKSNSEQGWNYQLVCRDGPVFDADDVLWEK